MIDEILAKLPQDGVYTLRDRVAQVVDVLNMSSTPAKNPTTRTFDTHYLVDKLELPHTAIECAIVGRERWTIVYDCFFATDELPTGYAWKARYSVGATEKQCVRPWENDDEVECTLVRLAPIRLNGWVAAMMPESGT